MNRILGIFSSLHREGQIGSDCFLASYIPLEGDEEDRDHEYASPPGRDDRKEMKFVDGLEFYIANDDANATHEVLVSSRKDADLLKGEVVRRKSSAKTLNENNARRDAGRDGFSHRSRPTA